MYDSYWLAHSVLMLERQDKPSPQNVSEESKVRTSANTFLSLYFQTANASAIKNVQYLSLLDIVDQEF